jgi:hypothetical protein
MKKVTFLLATLLIGGMMLTGCKKDDPKPTPDTPSTPTTAKVTYKIDNKMSSLPFVTSDCFKYTITYVDADGKQVTVNDITLPWTSPELTVTLPFDAKMEGKYTYKEEELPDQVCFGQITTIFSGEKPIANGSGDNIASLTKAGFLHYVSENPDVTSFSLSGRVE